MTTVDYFRTVKETIKVKNCPFCGSMRLRYVNDNEYNNPAERIICEQCYAKGPIAVEHEDVISRWNKRVTENENN